MTRKTLFRGYCNKSIAVGERLQQRQQAIGDLQPMSRGKGVSECKFTKKRHKGWRDS